MDGWIGGVVQPKMGTRSQIYGTSLTDLNQVAELVPLKSIKSIYKKWHHSELPLQYNKMHAYTTAERRLTTTMR